MNRLTVVFAAGSLAVAAIAQPPEPAPSAPDALPVASAKRERAGYIGIVTSAAPEALREQIGLPRGVGVLIEFVDPASPASRAGLQPHDVIHKINDQIVINVHQLTVLVRLHKPGETVRLSLIRRAQPVHVDIELVEKDLPALEEPVGLVIPPALRDGPPLPRVGAGHISGVMTFSDGQHVITITTRDDQRDLLIKDRAGRTLHEGPLNTDDDRNRLTPELREKVDRIERSIERLRKLRADPANEST